MLYTIAIILFILWLLGLVSLVNDSASELVYPLVPLYLASVLMAGPRTLGLIEGFAAKIKGMVSGATIDARNVFISGGVQGMNRGLITAKEDVRAILRALTLSVSYCLTREEGSTHA